MPKLTYAPGAVVTLPDGGQARVIRQRDDVLLVQHLSSGDIWKVSVAEITTGTWIASPREIQRDVRDPRYICVWLRIHIRKPATVRRWHRYA